MPFELLLGPHELTAGLRIVCSGKGVRVSRGLFSAEKFEVKRQQSLSLGEILSRKSV